MTVPMGLPTASDQKYPCPNCPCLHLIIRHCEGCETDVCQPCWLEHNEDRACHIADAKPCQPRLGGDYDEAPLVVSLDDIRPSAPPMPLSESLGLPTSASPCYACGGTKEVSPLIIQSYFGTDITLIPGVHRMECPICLPPEEEGDSTSDV